MADTKKLYVYSIYDGKYHKDVLTVWERQKSYKICPGQNTACVFYHTIINKSEIGRPQRNAHEPIRICFTEPKDVVAAALLSHVVAREVEALRKEVDALNGIMAEFGAILFEQGGENT